MPADTSPDPRQTYGDLGTLTGRIEQDRPVDGTVDMVRSLEDEALRRLEEVHAAHRRELAEVTAMAEARVARAEEEVRTRAAELVELTRLLAEAEHRVRVAESHSVADLPAAVKALRGEAVRHARVVAQLRESERLRPAARVRQRKQRARLARLDEQAVIQVIRESPLFHPGWYLETYPDVREAGIDPVVHYVLHGAGENRDPSPVFSTKRYLRRYPDVAASGANPLAHYETVGRLEGRTFLRVRRQPRG